jgi:inner membrane protein
MASAISHALIGASIGLLLAPNAKRDGDELARALAAARARELGRALPVAGAVLAVLPDADVLMHAWVRYEHPFGHRGAFHSIGVYLAVAALVAAWPAFAGERLRLALCAFVALLSHSLLDMLTNGGLGIALFWPLSPARLFFPWRPIPVSPLSIARFFSDWGLRVLSVELAFALPALALAIAVRWRRSRAAPSVGAQRGA